MSGYKWDKGICSNSPILNGRLPCWEDSSRPPSPSWNPSLWDDPGLNVRYLWIFQVDHTFYKLDVKILAANNEIRCMRCPCSPSSSSAFDPCQQKHLLFWHQWIKCQERVWKSMQFVIFKPWKVLRNYYWYWFIRLLLKFFCYVRWIFKKVLAKTMQNSTFWG